MSTHIKTKHFSNKKFDSKNSDSVWHDTTPNAWNVYREKSNFVANSTLDLLRSFIDDALHFP